MYFHQNRFFTSYFSLVELLVIFSILAILFSLVSPNYQNLISKSHQLECKNKLRHYQVAHTLYSYDHDGLMVPIWRTVPSGTPGNWHKNFWIGNSVYLSYMGIEGTVNIPEEYKCPSISEESIANHSYGINKDPIGWVKDHTLNFTRVASPSQKVFLTEGTDFHLNRGYANYTTKWDVYRESRLWIVAFRHMEGANMSFMDGHIEYRYKQDIYFPNDPDMRKDLWEINREAFTFSN